ncbi:MAG: glycine cleavage system aminomethyltransferase GcvT [Paracoccus sp. (in: a-proteobacteria)]|nr:glycine cleavage system aminomethyltransferase GcvT [Paracoccus sp. (in: a-proteobacteria)]
MADDLRRTGLFDFHIAEGARMVPFAGWDMPVQYTTGVLGEHLHTRAHASLFDVGHMGQVLVIPGEGGMEGAALALESLIPTDILGLKPDRQRYGLFTDEEGGILDDLMIANRGDHFYLVVNASRVAEDMAHLQSLSGVEIRHVTDRGLIALQGPEAAAVLARLLPDVAGMSFMDIRTLDWQGADLWVSRSGYTGEDGFEISVPDTHVAALADALMEQPEVAPAGLGARDSLRLEAGLPLYGHDMDENVSPSEASLGWSIPKVRRRGGAREGGFPGARGVLMELEEGVSRARRGLRPEGRAPVREGVELFDAEIGGHSLGRVSSGGFGPSVGGPVAVAILDPALPDGTRLWAELRGKRIPVVISPMPFVKPSYKR